MSPDCPCCSTPTRPARWKDVRGFECPSCKGHLVRAKQIENFLGSDKFTTFMALVHAAPVSRRPLGCPACGMRSFHALRHSGVAIDVCSSCMCVYFDAGEATLYLRQGLVGKSGAEAADNTADKAADSIQALIDLITDTLD